MHDHNRQRHATVRLLLVDNDDHFLSSLEQLFKSGGFETCATWSAHEALYMLHHKDFDAILVGDHLPDLHCGEFLKRARQESPTIYTVLMQHHRHSLKRSQMRHFKGADAVVQKADTSNILKTVAQHATANH